MILLQVGTLTYHFLSPAHLISSRQTTGAPVHWLGSSGHIPSGVRQQPHQWNPDSGGTPGPESLVGSQWLRGNSGLHTDSPTACSGQVGTSTHASSSLQISDFGHQWQSPTLPRKTLLILQNPYLSGVRGQGIIYILYYFSLIIHYIILLQWLINYFLSAFCLFGQKYIWVLFF